MYFYAVVHASFSLRFLTAYFCKLLILVYIFYNQPPTKPLFRATLALIVLKCVLIYFLICSWSKHMHECTRAHRLTFIVISVTDVLHKQGPLLYNFYDLHSFIFYVSSDRDQFTWLNRHDD